MRDNGISTAAELSRKANVEQGQVGALLNLKIEAATSTGAWRSWVVKIADALRCLPEDIVPPGHVHSKLEHNRTERAVSSAEIGWLLDTHSRDPQRALEQKEAIRALEKAIAELPEREQDILRRRWGLETGNVATLQQVGERYHISRENVRRIECNAFRKLRHPSRREQLAAGLEAFNS
jgi:RNA polymerase sigma factor (sigma-70 family)